MLLFAAGARRIPFSLLGILQYLTPTILLALGVWLYHEPFGTNRAIGFGLVWAGITVYVVEGLLALRARRYAA